MTLEETARRLGEALAGSPEFAELVRWERAYAADAVAQALVKSAQDAGAQIQELKRLGKVLDPAEAKRIAQVQANLDACKVVQQLVAAQKAYEALAQKLNGVVQAVVEEKRKKE
ncbi:MAG: hypothetical protein FD180_587 [Planctomycetota bacterium]|nr:MAG: hypothetical protein FD180_587 [Planctomycetota bacterium]